MNIALLKLYLNETAARAGSERPQHASMKRTTRLAVTILRWVVLGVVIAVAAWLFASALFDWFGHVWAEI
jgi:type VI protein secretion system component VasF